MPIATEVDRPTQSPAASAPVSPPPIPAAGEGWTTLIDFFEEIAQFPGEFVIHDDGYRSWTYSYRDVARAARTFAARLRNAGLEKGQKVVIWSESRAEWLVALWGCLLEGVIVVPIDFRSSDEFVLRIAGIVQACRILIGDEVQGSRLRQDGRVWRLSEIEWSGVEETAHAQISRDDIAEIVFTSGATGEPKGVILTHRNVLASMPTTYAALKKYRKYLRPFFPVRVLNLLPLSHMFGQALATILPPMVPASVVFMRSNTPNDVIAQIHSRRACALIAVPKMLESLKQYLLHQQPTLAAPQDRNAHWLLRWWKYRKIHRMFGLKFWCFVMGGAPLEPALEEFWTRLGFIVIQGYGLTETAPIVTFSEPLDSVPGTVGRPIAGMEVKIAPDGEIVLRGEGVTPGYFSAEKQTAEAFHGGWFHTGDLGEFDPEGHLTILGRKKEMIVTPEGLKVFPEDVERVLNARRGVRDSAVVGPEHVHAVLLLDPAADKNVIVREANLRLEPHQRIQRVSIWPGESLPRTTSTQKLKRAEIQNWVALGAAPRIEATPELSIPKLLEKYAPGRAITPDATLDELGLSSLDRVELLVDLEAQLGRPVEESLLTGDRKISELAAQPPAPEHPAFPVWSRKLPYRMLRRIVLPGAILPLTKFFARIEVRGLENLPATAAPVLFASNHQSNLDTPVILACLPGRFRYRVSVAMWKEYFDAHFYPAQHSLRDWLLNSLLYYSIAEVFNAFPLPQSQPGTRQSLRYMGELVSGGQSLLIFPEGERTERGEVKSFQPGIGMMAARLRLPVVPIRVSGLEQVLHRGEALPHHGPVHVSFGSSILLKGDDYAGMASQIREAILKL
jgi:long-chain acyl-CoA synthetase